MKIFYSTIINCSLDDVSSLKNEKIVQLYEYIFIFEKEFSKMCIFIKGFCTSKGSKFISQLSIRIGLLVLLAFVIKVKFETYFRIQGSQINSRWKLDAISSRDSYFLKIFNIHLSRLEGRKDPQNSNPGVLSSTIKS